MLSYRITKKFSTERIKETEIMLAQPSSRNFYVELSKHPSEYYRITPSLSNFDFDELPMYDESENFLLFNRIEIKNRESKDSLYHVKTIFKSFGENSKAAKANLKEFDFRIQQNDSILYIPQFFSVPKSQGFRSQTIVVEIYTPSNINVRYDENIIEYQEPINQDTRLNRSMTQKYDDYGYENNYIDKVEEIDSLENAGLINSEIEQDSL